MSALTAYEEYIIMPGVVTDLGIFIIGDQNWRQFHCNSPGNKVKKDIHSAGTLT